MKHRGDSLAYVLSGYSQNNPIVFTIFHMKRMRLQKIKSLDLPGPQLENDGGGI